MADTGDGFDATYSVAYLLAQPSLTVDGETLPRGQALVLGGDQVYPTAEQPGATRTGSRGPFRAALPVRGAAARRRRRCTRCPATTTGTTG